MLEVSDLVPVQVATSDVDVDRAIKVALTTHGPLGSAELREKARLSGATTGNPHIDARVKALVQAGTITTRKGPRAKVLHSLAGAAIQNLQHNGVLPVGP